MDITDMNQQAVETAKATPPLVDITDEVEKREDGQREDSGAPKEAKSRSDVRRMRQEVRQRPYAGLSQKHPSQVR